MTIEHTEIHSIAARRMNLLLVIARCMCSCNLLVVLTSNHSFLFAHFFYYYLLLLHSHRWISISLISTVSHSIPYPSQCYSKMIPWWFPSDCRVLFIQTHFTLIYLTFSFLNWLNVIFSLIIFTRQSYHVALSHTQNPCTALYPLTLNPYVHWPNIYDPCIGISNQKNQHNQRKSIACEFRK